MAAEVGTEVVTDVLPYLIEKLPEILTSLSDLGSLIDPDPTDDITILSQQDEILTALNTVIEQQNTLITLMYYVFVILIIWLGFKLVYKFISVINGC